MTRVGRVLAVMGTIVIVGACCGSDPEHIRLISEVVRRRPRPERGPIDALLVVRREAGRTV